MRLTRPAAAATLVILVLVFAAAPTTLLGTPSAAPTAAPEQPATATSGNPPPSPPTAQPGTRPTDGMAAKMTTYYVAFLRRSATAPPSGPGRAELMQGHMANIQRLAKEGKLVLAGPFLEQSGPGSLAGLFFLQAASAAEARELVDTDPTLKAGVFTVEIVPWLGPKVLAKIPEMFDHEP